ncbi:Sugar transporter STL1 [Cyphellophora attinorum]|uniref:Sugar transporter STL1 n=1 Tax=Cyphellophora attinorum TaxID=1664694 RepID=A0A0N1H547_9EURO|nr:Sugar transporter STL1 [Phialophora attinorum]KPI40722.1 Sugar transporter STL1 [Phialophora attinorum]
MPRKHLGLRGGALHAAIWAESCVLVAIFGYNQAGAGSVLPTRSFNEQFPQMDVLNTTGAQKSHNSTIQGTVIALYTLFGVFGALACTFFGDTVGRRWTLWIACLFNLIGAVIMCSAFSFAQFIVSRIILGLGTGAVIATTSVWQSELSKASSRGSHVSAFGIFCGIGLLLALWIAFGTSYAINSFAWRFPLAVPIVFSLIAMPTIFLLPESPRWLVKQGRDSEAHAIMELLHEDPEVVESEMTAIRISLSMSGEASSISSIFRMGEQRVFHRAALGCLAQMMLQMTGVNSITYYASSLFEAQLGFDAKTAEALAAGSYFALLLGGLICSFTVDRFGRRRLMLFSAASMSVCFAFEAGLVAHPDNKAGLKVAVFFIYLFQVVYTVGFLGLPFLYASEIAPAKERAAICGLSTATSWLFNFLVAEITPVAFTSIGWRYFIVYCVLNASWIPIIYFLFPETQGRSLEEIDEIFVQSKSIFDTVAVARRLPHKPLPAFEPALEKQIHEGDGESPLKIRALHLEEVPPQTTTLKEW